MNFADWEKQKNFWRGPDEWLCAKRQSVQALHMVLVPVLLGPSTQFKSSR